MQVLIFPGTVRT